MDKHDIIKGKHIMEAIRQKLRIPKSREIKIKVPQYIPENQIAEVILLLNRETKESKINELMEAANDPVFMNDMYEIAEDFKEIDKAEWE
jgi:hypothetical protein